MKKEEKRHSRRTFLKTSGSVAAGSALTLNFISGNSAFAMNNDTLKVGLIGCGGRGTGAANQALQADDNVVLTCMADTFEDRINKSLDNLKKERGDKVQVIPESQYVGFDGYKKVIESDVDVVILTTPPCFRPAMLEAAVKAGKHVFCEKPMAVDAQGVRRVIAAAQIAKEKKISLVSGFCWRYHLPKREVFQRIHDGDIGEVHTVYSTYNTGTLWSIPWEDGWTLMTRQMRNWLYYNWLSGDHIVEQAVHSIDMGSWAMADMQPKSVTATGGRQVRTDEVFGNIYDHFAVEYAYENGAKSFHFSRQQKNCSRSNHVEVWGTKGKAIIDVIRRIDEIKGEKPWRYRGDGNNMYQQEHDELFASIRSGKLTNDGEWMAQSNMMAIMGRMAAYTGQTITYKEALKSKEVIGPSIEEYDWDLEFEGPPVAMPGITKFK
jgi:predicted dehydrogenase